MENWYERVVHNLENMLATNCELLKAMIKEGHLLIEEKPFEKVVEFSVHFLEPETEIWDSLVFKYNQYENHFYYEMNVTENEPQLIVILNSLEQLIGYIHERIHEAIDGCTPMEYSYFENEEELIKHIEGVANDKENEDDRLKNIEWYSNVESVAKIDVPKKKEVKSIMHFGKNEEHNELIIKKALFINEEEAGQAELSYLRLNKEEAKKIIEELQKYTAS